jgi:hypothetical protein
VHQTVEQLLVELKASEHDKFAAHLYRSRMEYRQRLAWQANRAVQASRDSNALLPSAAPRTPPQYIHYDKTFELKVEGKENIKAMLEATVPDAKPGQWRIEGDSS